MQASMYQCHADPDAPHYEQPEATVRIDEDGDFVLSFSEFPTNSLRVVMNKKQFIALAGRIVTLLEAKTPRLEVK